MGGRDGIGHGWGFRQLPPGHPGFLSNSEFLWPLATALTSTVKYRLHSAFSPGIQTSTGTSLRRSLLADVYFTRSFLLGQLGLSGHLLCIYFVLHSGHGVVGHLKAVQQLGRAKRDKLGSEDGGRCSPVCEPRTSCSFGNFRSGSSFSKEINDFSKASAVPITVVFVFGP